MHRWSSDLILDFLVLFYALTGRFPKQKTASGQGWAPGDVEFMAANGILSPGTTTVRHYFGSFHHAVFCALIDLGQSEEDALDYIKLNYIKANLKDLRSTEKKYTLVSDDQLLERLYDAKLVIGAYPKSHPSKSQLAITNQLDVPSEQTYSRRFGSYRRAKELAEERATLKHYYDGENSCNLDSPSQGLLAQVSLPL